MRYTRLHSQQSGFTIVELTIATMVFTTVLLVVTVGVLSFTRSYYKGVNSSATQNTARSIIDNVSQAVQFSGSDVSAGNSITASGDSFFCVGGYAYVYSKGVEYTGAAPTNGRAGLYVNKVNGTCPAPGWTPPTSGAGNFYAGGNELLTTHMRIANLTFANNPHAVAGGNNTYGITLRVAYGDSDLLCSPSQNGHPSGCLAGDASNGPTAPFSGSDIICKSQLGSQFCDVSNLSTTIMKRVN